MGKKIVFFGVDNSGKTTACHQFAKAMKEEGYTVEVFNSQGPKDAISMLTRMKLFSETEADFVVADRFHALEELVYGPVLRGYNKLEPFRTQCIEAIDSVDLFVHCCPPEEVISNYGDREQMEGIKENQKIFTLLFEHYMKLIYPKLGKKLITYDWTRDSGNLINIVKGALK